MPAHRYAFAALVAAFVLWGLYAFGNANADPPSPTTTGDTVPLPPPAPPADPFAEAQAFEIAALRAELRSDRHKLAEARARARGLRRTLAHTSSTREAIDLACSVYGNCDTLWRRARCESGLSPTAHNPSGASGLLQFLPSTWATTPFARFSIWSPYANAFAGAWMIAHGRGGEWVCQ